MSRDPLLVVFDCDGTLVDSQANIIQALGLCFDKHGLDAPCAQAARRIVGLSLVEAMQAMLPEAEPDLHVALAQDYKRAFQKLRAAGTLAHEPLFDGTREVLEALEARGSMLGVATGKSDRGLALCLEHHNLAHHFVTLQTADRHPSKPHPSMLHAAMAETASAPERTAMVGDTVYDIHMARAAGVLPIGVAWGYHEPDELRAAGAVAVLERYEDLHDVLERNL
ncbi:HAD-IA family hydrolase [Pedomonas mirosovicensis]|uniref:HAD-IA family hydrolase n=1 Tax=Pedomonas mirosovicensis TaxID=2908641 RepID=UPI00216A15CF|nr:HAD-IA family hydrolase [Pedomonas mirosovicensis]MCH8685992.1 HAD-IA family hydrolase [Pedomonas mirosovicensis]